MSEMKQTITVVSGEIAISPKVTHMSTGGEPTPVVHAIGIKGGDSVRVSLVVGGQPDVVQTNRILSGKGR